MVNDDSIDRRTFLECMGLSGAVALAGCMGGEGGQASIEGGQLRLSVGWDIDTLNPLSVINQPEFVAVGWLYSKLTRVDNELKVQPDLATDWEPNSDLTEWTFSLRDDAKFHHNDQQVTAEDVKVTLEAIQNPENSSTGQGTIGPIESVEVDDETTARIVLSSPYSDIPIKMAKQYPCILPKDVVENDLESVANTDYGSGPFILEELEKGSHLKVTANDDFYMEDEEGNSLPYLDTVSQEVYPEPTSEISALQNKQTDAMWQVPASNWSRVTNLQDVKTRQQPSGTFPSVMMRTDTEPFNDNRVRRAFKLAIDREAMLEGAKQGLGQVANDHPIGPVYRHAPELPQRERDLDKAKSLIEDAGYNDGLELELIAADSPPVREQVAVLLKEQLKPINVTINVKTMSYDRWISNFWSQDDFYVSYYSVQYTEDGILYKLLHSEGPWNEAAFSHEELDNLLEEARRTNDSNKRSELYKQASKIVRDEGPYIIPFFYDRLAAQRTYVEDLELIPGSVELPAERAHLTDDAPNK